jgi:hypothetical protein
VEAPEMAGASSCTLAKSLCIFRDFSEDGWNQLFATTFSHSLQMMYSQNCSQLLLNCAAAA